jgi:general secretion pathway protein F
MAFGQNFVSGASRCAFMDSPTLDDFVALNDQLAALLEAGVPIDLGLGPSVNDPTQALKTINATVARRVGRGESLNQAIEDDHEIVPSAYRSMVELGLRSGNLAAALTGSSRVAGSVDDSRDAIRSSFIYPLVVCGLAFVGLIASCRFFIPALEDMYHSLRVRPGSGLQVLQMMRSSLPFWIAVPPAALLWFVWRSNAKPTAAIAAGRPTGVSAWLPGMRQALFQEQCANFAEALATLIDSHVPFEEALPLAAGSCGNMRIGEASRSLATTLMENKTPADDSPAAVQFPPFLRWALLHSEATTGRARALSMAADIYRQSARRREERLRIVAPVFVCVVVGGGATLLYGLSLFVPVVQLLNSLAS